MRKTYLYTSSAISTLDSFDGVDFVNSPKAIEENKEIIHPVYKNYIAPMGLRRMGVATKMAVATGFKCLENAKVEQPDAIIVGTGLGSLVDTQKFLNVSITMQNSLLPPTSFIQSGHNAMAGQIALMLKNDSYNMTHVQQGVSFEHAMLDTILCISEGKNQVLTGAVDEHTPVIADLAERFELDSKIANQLSQGSAFFMFGSDESKAKVEVVKVAIEQTTDIHQSVNSFLKSNGLTETDILAGFTGYNLRVPRDEKFGFTTICYTDYCGQHAATSAFGMHFATAYLDDKPSNSHALVININANNSIGLTLLRSV